MPGGLRGSLARIPLPDLLRELQSNSSTGILALTTDGMRKALYLKGGRVVFAMSNVPSSATSRMRRISDASEWTRWPS